MFLLMSGPQDIESRQTCFFTLSFYGEYRSRFYIKLLLQLFNIYKNTVLHITVERAGTVRTSLGENSIWLVVITAFAGRIYGYGVGKLHDRGLSLHFSPLTFVLHFHSLLNFFGLLLYGQCT